MACCSARLTRAATYLLGVLYRGVKIRCGLLRFPKCEHATSLLESADRCKLVCHYFSFSFIKIPSLPHRPPQPRCSRHLSTSPSRKGVEESYILSVKISGV